MWHDRVSMRGVYLNMARIVKNNKKNVVSSSHILLFLLYSNHLCKANSGAGDLLSPYKDNRIHNDHNFVANNNNCNSRDDIDCVLNEFIISFPFLESNMRTLNKTLRSLNLPEGVYVGQLKPFLQGSVDDDKTDNLLSFDQNDDNTVVENGAKLANKPVRHGWGKMSWQNGTLYGTDLQFIYLEGDEYLGHWSNDLQNGNCGNSISIVFTFLFSELILQIS